MARASELMGLSMNQMRVHKNAWGKRITAPGCDDAEVVEIEIGEFPKPVTLILPYYNNPETLVARLAAYAALPFEFRKFFRLIVVDDASPKPALAAIERMDLPATFSLYRIKDDVRWNWLAARNIGAHEADDGSWLCMTDMDHGIAFNTRTELVWGKHDPSVIYRFSRRDESADGPEIHPHPNSWMMTKAMFWKVGGYDERLSGLYGTDGSFRRRCVRTAPIKISARPLIRAEHVADASTTDYGRKEACDREVARIAAELEETPPRVLSFAYERVL